MTKGFMLLLLAAAIVVLAVLGSPGPDPQRAPRSTGPTPPEERTDIASVECRLYVSFGTSGSGRSPSVRSITVAGPASMLEGGSEDRTYRRVTVSDGTTSVVSVHVGDPTGCASAMPTARVARDRT